VIASWPGRLRAWWGGAPASPAPPPPATGAPAIPRWTPPPNWPWGRYAAGVLDVDGCSPPATTWATLAGARRLEGPKAGSPRLARRDPATGVLQGAADPRREGYAPGW